MFAGGYVWDSRKLVLKDGTKGIQICKAALESF